MKYIKIFEDFNNNTGLKDLILAVSESPVHIKTLSGFQIWQCENLDEAGLNDLKERLSYLDLEAFDCGKYYESGTEIGHRLIICEKGKVNLIPVDTYGEKVADIFRKYPASWFFYSIFDVVWEYDYRKSTVRELLDIHIDYQPKMSFDLNITSPSVDNNQIKTKSVYESIHDSPWSFYDQTYITGYDCSTLDYVSRYGVNEVQDKIGHQLFFKYMEEKGINPKVGSWAR
jgi:hypothetical protein